MAKWQKVNESIRRNCFSFAEILIRSLIAALVRILYAGLISSQNLINEGASTNDYGKFLSVIEIASWRSIRLWVDFVREAILYCSKVSWIFWVFDWLSFFFSLSIFSKWYAKFPVLYLLKKLLCIYCISVLVFHQNHLFLLKCDFIPSYILSFIVPYFQNNNSHNTLGLYKHFLYMTHIFSSIVCKK